MQRRCDIKIADSYLYKYKIEGGGVYVCEGKVMLDI